MEFIERSIKSKKIQIDREKYPKVQVALNSFGHLTVRYFNNESQDKDAIIVFDAETTREIVAFLRGRLRYLLDP